MDQQDISTTGPALAEAKALFLQAVERVKAAREALQGCQVRREKFEKCLQAAQAEADDAKAQWRSKLKQSDGELTKEIRNLRAAERGAYTLIEEYQSILDEMADVQKQLSLALATSGEDCLHHRGKVLEVTADGAFEELVQQHGEAIGRAMRLFIAAQVAGDRKIPYSFTQWGGPEGRARLHDAFMSKLHDVALKHQNTACAVLDDVNVDLSDVPFNLVQTPAQRHFSRVLSAENDSTIAPVGDDCAVR